jgi:hypothetical protein
VLIRMFVITLVVGAGEEEPRECNGEGDLVQNTLSTLMKWPQCNPFVLSMPTKNEKFKIRYYYFSNKYLHLCLSSRLPPQ